MNHDLTVSSFSFKPVEVPLELVGLTPKDLFDLFDIAVKWGTLVDKGCMIGCTFTDGKGKMIIAAHSWKLGPSNVGIFICREYPSIPSIFAAPQGMILFKTLARAIIMWDKLVSLDEARNAIVAIDGYAKTNGVFTASSDRISR
ncbi:MAG: hypothetical protein NTW11_00900 [Candidatus Staskawiczbacteria bacterium]|nr:hypothetical protein [Candidatus Staskawiczbacteria bacterium]